MNCLNILRKNLRTNTKSYCKWFSTQNPINGRNECQEKALTFDDFKCLATNRVTEAKIKLILNEYLNYKNSDEDVNTVPSTLTIGQMRQLLACNKTKRKGRGWKDLSAKQRKHLLFLMKRSQDIDGYNRLTTPLMPYQVNNRTINANKLNSIVFIFKFEKFYTNRLRNSALFGQNIVFDISFDDHMSTLECKNLAEQLYRIYKFNRFETLKYSAEELPFTLNICNASEGQKSMKFLSFLYPDLISHQSFVNITEKSYLDIFPKEDLIYLSPHADHVLTEYDPTAVYIIGGIVDRKEIITLSQPKAVKQDIRSMRLPIDSIIAKSNVQSLDSVFRILFDFKVFGVITSKMSLEERVRRHLPQHKLKTVYQTTYQRIVSEYLNELEDEEDFHREMEDIDCS